MAQTVSAALARKLSSGQDDLGDKPRSVLRGLRLALARAAKDRLQLALSVIGAKQSNRTPDELGDVIGNDWLLLLLSAGDGVVAAVCLDPNTVSAIVQTQTIGEVTADIPAPRTFTDTDAAMVSPFVEDTLGRAVLLVDAAGDRVVLAGYEFASNLEDLRSLTLALTEDSYRVFDLTVELAGGLRQGQISVLLPDIPATATLPEDTVAKNGPSLELATGVVRAELSGVICRMTLPLTTLSDLRAGDVLPLIGARLDRTEILTIDRTRAAVGRLGQCGGMRAVRVNEQLPLPALAGLGDQEFLESKTGLDQPELPEAPVPVENALSIMSAAPEPLPDDELNFDDSDQMVAEISQLAGLTGSEGGRDPNG